MELNFGFSIDMFPYLAVVLIGGAVVLSIALIIGLDCAFAFVLY